MINFIDNALKQVTLPSTFLSVVHAGPRPFEQALLSYTLGLILWIWVFY